MGMKRVTLIFIFTTAFFTGSAFSQNPIIQTIYTPDPAPMVYNDTVYVYTGHDEDGSTWFTMNEWRVYSSADMVNWTDHGSPLSLESFSWADSDAWAAQCIFRNGEFYYYICAHHSSLNRMAVGVAVSDSPTGPFTDPLGEPLVAAHWGDIDPTVFIDDDGQAYLYWGNPDLWYVMLNEDMISYDQTAGVVQVPLTADGFGERTGDPDRSTLYEEGPWFYKRNGLYYLLFAAGGIPEYISYSTSSSPVGPWTYQGVIMPTQGGSFTNHPGVIDYKGNSYFFYHNGALPGGGGFTRSTCVEQFTYNVDGSFPTINMTTAGIVNAVGDLNPYQRNEAETIAWESGVETETCSQGGVNVYSIESGDRIKIRNVDFGENGASVFTASISSATVGGTIELYLNNMSEAPIGILPVNYTGGWDNWREEATSISGVAGVNDLYFVFRGAGSIHLFKMDYWKFEPKSEIHDLLAINATVDNYKIDIVPSSNTATLTVLAVYADGTSEDVTAEAEISPEQEDVVDISGGIITGIDYSPVTINISYQGKTDIVNMLIMDLESEMTARTLTLDQDTFDLLSGSTAQVTVTVEYQDGHKEDVTNEASYENPDNSIATISAGTIIAKSSGTTIITVSFEDLLGNTVTAQLTVNVSNRDPYQRNEAEEYNAQNGIQTEDCSDAGGGTNVGYIENGDWLRYNALDFGSGAASFDVRVASATNGGNLEIRLDSPNGALAGTCTITGTGGWQTWVTRSCDITDLSGIHDIFLKCTGGGGYLFNINWWKFESEQNTVSPEKGSSSNETIDDYFLGQGFPNPFNPTTVIRYQLPDRSDVSLKVYDILGKEIKTLFEGNLQSGNYEMIFDGSDLSSGVYIAKLTAERFKKSIKLILQK